MTIEEIRDIERVPLAIDYRRMYRGRLVVSLAGRHLTPTAIEFVLEMSPLGRHDVTVSFLEQAEYPLVPVMKVVKEHISALDRAGSLP